MAMSRADSPRTTDLGFLAAVNVPGHGYRAENAPKQSTPFFYAPKTNNRLCNSIFVVKSSQFSPLLQFNFPLFSCFFNILHSYKK